LAPVKSLTSSSLAVDFVSDTCPLKLDQPFIEIDTEMLKFKVMSLEYHNKASD
jgi:hypothetical protein